MSAVAPFVAAVSPPTAGTGGLAKVQVRLTGDRFAAGATVRATSQGGTTSLTAPATLTGTTSLTAELDLSAAPPGTWTLRVVNPNQVVSNGKPFAVVIPTPEITRVAPSPDASPGTTPPAVAAGGPRTLLLEGKGLMLSSGCRISGGTVAELGLPAELTEEGLACTLDASSLQPGQYQVWVFNDTAHVSAKAAFQIVSAQPTLTTLAPSGVRFNSAPAPVQLFGSGFDVTSKALLSGAGTSDVELATTLVDATRLIASAVDLQHCPTAPCATSDGSHRYFLQVRNGSGATAKLSEKVEIVVDAQTRAVATAQPGLGLAGRPAPPHHLRDRPAAAACWRPARPAAPSPTRPRPRRPATGPRSRAWWTWSARPPGAAPAGSWDVRLRFPSGATSASFALRVDSNQAVITATPVPAGGRAGDDVAVSLSVTNLRPPASGVRVRLSDPSPGATFSLPIVPSAVPAGTSGTVTAVLPLQGLHTGVYSLAVVNPNGAAASAPYSFTVPAGRAPGGRGGLHLGEAAGGTNQCESATSAKQQATPVPIRITGANFAQPDAAGNNGSQVLVPTPPSAS